MRARLAIVLLVACYQPVHVTIDARGTDARSDAPAIDAVRPDAPAVGSSCFFDNFTTGDTTGQPPHGMWGSATRLGAPKLFGASVVASGVELSTLIGSADQGVVLPLLRSFSESLNVTHGGSISVELVTLPPDGVEVELVATLPGQGTVQIGAVGSALESTIVMGNQTDAQAGSGTTLTAGATVEIVFSQGAAETLYRVGSGVQTAIAFTALPGSDTKFDFSLQLDSVVVQTLQADAVFDDVSVTCPQ